MPAGRPSKIKIVVNGEEVDASNHTSIEYSDEDVDNLCNALNMWSATEEEGRRISEILGKDEKGKG